MIRPVIKKAFVAIAAAAQLSLAWWVFVHWPVVGQVQGSDSLVDAEAALTPITFVHVDFILISDAALAEYNAQARTPIGGDYQQALDKDDQALLYRIACGRMHSVVEGDPVYRAGELHIRPDKSEVVAQFISDRDPSGLMMVYRSQSDIFFLRHQICFNFKVEPEPDKKTARIQCGLSLHDELRQSADATIPIGRTFVTQPTKAVLQADENYPADDRTLLVTVNVSTRMVDKEKQVEWDIEESLDGYLGKNLRMTGSLEEVLSDLAKRGKLNMKVDWKTLASVGVTKADQIDIEFEGDTDLREALNRVLFSAGPFKISLGYEVVDGELLVSTEAEKRRAVERVAERKMAKRLDLRLPGDWNADEQGLERVLGSLADRGNIYVVVDWKTLEAKGIERGSRISLSMHDATLRECLTETIGKAGPPTSVAWQARDGFILVSTPEDLKARMEEYGWHD